MSKFSPLATALASLLALPSGAQDMAAAQKWATAKVVKYRGRPEKFHTDGRRKLGVDLHADAFAVAVTR